MKKLLGVIILFAVFTAPVFAGELISEGNKFVIALKPQAINNTNATGRYIHGANYGRIAFVLQGGAMAATKYTSVTVYQASDAAATGAAAIAEAGFVANQKVNELTVALSSVLANATIEINGLTFTAASGADLDDRKFSIAGNDTADGDSFVLAVNHTTAGVPLCLASNSAGTVTIRGYPAGATVVTCNQTSGTGMTVATVMGEAYVEVLTATAGETKPYFVARVDTTANTVADVIAILGDKRYGPVSQPVAAYTLY